MKIGPRYDVEGPADVGMDTLLETHKRRINGKTFQFIKVTSPSGSVTVHASEEIVISEQRHNLYIRAED